MQQTERRIFHVLILIACAAWIVISRDPGRTAAEHATLDRGSTAPDFTLSTIQGAEISLSDLRGRAVIVNFWATWCAPCKEEMPALQKLFDEYGPQGLVVLGINVTAQDDAYQVMPFVRRYGLTFPVLLDVSGDVSAAYALRSFPTTYFIDRDGRIDEIVIGGPMAEALLRTRIEEILN